MTTTTSTTTTIATTNAVLLTNQKGEMEMMKQTTIATAMELVKERIEVREARIIDLKASLEEAIKQLKVASTTGTVQVGGSYKNVVANPGMVCVCEQEIKHINQAIYLAQYEIAMMLAWAEVYPVIKEHQDSYISRKTRKIQRAEHRMNELQTIVETDCTNRITTNIQFFATKTNNEEEVIMNEKAKMVGAVEKLNVKRVRKAVNNQDQIVFERQIMDYDYDTNNWFFNTELISLNAGETIKSIITNYDLEVAEVKNGKQYFKADCLTQLDFKDAFGQSMNFDLLFREKTTGDFYVLLDAVRAPKRIGQKVRSWKGVWANLRTLENKHDIGEVLNMPCDNVLAKQDVLQAPQEARVRVSDAYELFVNITHSASGTRGLKNLFLHDRDNLVERVLEEGSHGIYSRVKGCAMNNAGVVKTNVRIMQGMSGSDNSVEADCIAIYCGEFGFGEVANPYSEKYRTLKGAFDGTGLISELIMEIKRAGQTRPASGKNAVKTVPQHCINTRVAFLDSNPIVLTISNDGVTEEQEAILESLYDGELNNRIVILKKQGVTHNDVHYLSDLNGFKAHCDALSYFRVPLLNTSKDKRLNFSGQIAQKMIECAGQKAVDLITDRLIQYFTEKFDSLKEAKKAGIKDVQNLYLAGTLPSIVPSIMDKDISAKKTQLKLFLNSLTSVTQKLAFPIKKSAYSVIFADPCGMYGKRILKENEVYIPGLKTGTKVLMIKYPTPGNYEFMIATAVSYTAICKRIDKLVELTDAQREDLKADYLATAPGEFVIAASKAVTDLEAGSDFDFDEMGAIWDEEIVACFDGVRPVLVKITTDKKAQVKDVIYNYLTMANPFLTTIKKENATVGGVTKNYEAPNHFSLNAKAHLERLNNFIKQAEEGLEKAKARKLNSAQIQSIEGELQTRKNSKAKQERAYMRFFEVMLNWSLMDEETFKNYKFEKNEVESWIYGEEKVYINNALNKKVLEKAKFEERTTEYEGLEVKSDTSVFYDFVEITEDDKQRMFNSLRTCKIDSMEVVYRICRDLNFVGRFDQEVTIDFAKTMTAATVLYNFSRFMGMYSDLVFSYTINDELQIVRTITNKNGFANLGKRYIFADLFSTIRENVHDVILAKVNNYLQAPVDESFVSSLTVPTGIVKNMSIFKQCTSVYGCVAMSKYANADITSKRAQKYYRALNNLFVNACDDIAPEKIGEFAVWCDYFTADGKQKKNKSAFSSSVVGAHSLLFWMGLEDCYFNVFEKLEYVVPEAQDEDQAIFNNGIAFEDGEIVCVAQDFLNGDFTLVEEIIEVPINNGGVKERSVWYATADIEDYLDLSTDDTCVAFVVNGKVDAKRDSIINGVAKGAITIDDVTYATYHYNLLAAYGLDKELAIEDIIEHIDDKGNVYSAVLAKVVGTLVITEENQETLEEEDFSTDEEFVSMISNTQISSKINLDFDFDFSDDEYYSPEEQ